VRLQALEIKTPGLFYCAGVAQLVEHLLAKQDVVSSNLITRSRLVVKIQQNEGR
jgi:hypothetical protein